MQRVERRRSLAALGLSVAVHALVVAWLLARPAPPVPAPPARPFARLVWLDAAPAKATGADPGATSAGNDSTGATAPASREVPLPRGAQPVAGAPSLPAASPMPERRGAAHGADDALGGAGGARATGTRAADDTPGGAAGARATGKHAADDTPGGAGGARATGTRAADDATPGAGAGAASAAEPGTTAGKDAPRALTWLPGTARLGAPTGAPRGHTLHPGDLPGDDERLAEESARVFDRVDGFARAATAAARVRGGLPDPLYGAMGAALREATAEVPKFIDTNSPREVGEAFANSWQAGAARYGATGAPYTEPEGRLEAFEKPSALAEAAAKGSPDGIALSQFFAAGARLQEFADGRAGAELYALVEIRQQGSGAVDSVTLLRPSGVVPFDRWVTERANRVAAGFSADAGARAKPYRSLWRFDGIVTFRRKLKMSELDARAAVGMMTMAALSLLSGVGNTTPPQGGAPRDLGPRMPAFVGRFDELTGEVDMVDLTNPQYDCRVTLLEAD